MAEQWFYRMFGEEFGPVSFEELKELADLGSLSSSDEVRTADSDEWSVAASVGQLGLTLEESVDSVSQPSVAESNGSAAMGGDAQPIKSADEWFCMIGGAELGPLTFEELTDYARNEQLCADDEVKLGSGGKWRRVGSIGRLMAVMPYKAIEKSIVPTPPKPRTPAFEHPVMEDFEAKLGGADEAGDPAEDDFEDLSSLVTDSTAPAAPSRMAPSRVAASAPLTAAPDSKAAFHAAYEEAKAKIAESMMAQAEASFKASEEQAKAQVAWAHGPNVDRQWWGWASGIEFGPVEFNQVFGLAKSGQLRPTDLVRNGQFNQFGAASNVPGLFTAVAMIARAAETLVLAKAQAQAAVALALPPPEVPESILNAPVAVSTPSASRIESEPRIPAPPTIKSDPNLNTGAPRQRMGPNLEAVARMQHSAPEALVEEPRPMRPIAAPETRPEPRPEMRPEPRPEPRPAAYSSQMGNPYGGMSTSSPMSVPRPVVIPRKPSPSRSRGSVFSGLAEKLQDPGTIKALGAITVVLLIVGWFYLPKSRAQDVNYYRTLKKILDEIKANRTNDTALAAIVAKAKPVAKEIAMSLHKTAGATEPAKQCLLWAARDEFSRACQAGFNTESIAEKMFAARLQEAAYQLGLEPRPKVPLVDQNAPLPDN